MLGGVGIPPALWHTYHSLKFVPAFVARLDAVIEPPPPPTLVFPLLLVEPALLPPVVPLMLPVVPPMLLAVMPWLLAASAEPAGDGSLPLSLSGSSSSKEPGGGGDLLWTFMCLRSELGCV